MRCKVIAGKKALIPEQDVQPEVAEMIFSLIKCRHHNAKLVVLR